MKVSIWQQFASNHSNNFTVVGQFASTNEAEVAYHQVRDVIRQLIESYKANPTDTWKYSPVEGERVRYPTSVELTVFQPFGIEPRRAVEWAEYHMSQEYTDKTIDLAVRFFENYLYVTDPPVGYGGAEPFNRLVQHLGGKILEVEETWEGLELATDIDCVAPDETTAHIIYQALHTQSNQPLPWLEYLGGQCHENPTQLRENERIY